MAEKVVEEVPKSFEERIMAYLKQHEDYAEGTFPYPVTVDDPRAQAEYIMREILFKLNKRVLCKDRYDNIKQWHNQYPLFEMEDFIPEFCIDEEIIKKMAFRETLLISELDSEHEDSRVGTPNPIGALCLHIDAVDAILPEGIKKEITDHQLELEVLEALKHAKGISGPLSKTPLDQKQQQTELEEIEFELQKKLSEYEKFLNDEIRENATKFVVHLSSQFSAGFNGGSRITAWVDRNFHTLEEKRTEYAEIEDQCLDEKSLYVALQSKKYYLRTYSLKENFEQKQYYNLAKARNMVCEGANFILMRYLAITKYKGHFELSTLYINGDLCRNIYECSGPKMGIVNNKKIQICKIYRYIIEKCGLEHHCVTVMTVYGRIVTQEWDGCKIIINMNPLQHISSKEPSPYDRLNLDKTWYDDMEMLSRYLDSKTEAELKMKTYMNDHPEVKEILADYLNNVLLLKPQNILSFTVDFFKSLCPIRMSKMGDAET